MFKTLICLNINNRSQINIPAVHIWHDECGAHAIPLTQALWLFNLATGVQGTLTSNIITFKYNKSISLMYKFNLKLLLTSQASIATVAR